MARITVEDCLENVDNRFQLVLLAAKRAGLLESVRPELDALVRTAFFLSPQLYDKLLLAAGETDS